jgi:hypothetical protein
MKKLVAKHESSYIYGKIPKSPDGTSYGFANRENGLLIESTSDPPFLLDSHASYENFNLWKFGPEPLGELETLTYDIWSDDQGVYSQVAENLGES